MTVTTVLLAEDIEGLLRDVLKIPQEVKCEFLLVEECTGHGMNELYEKIFKGVSFTATK